MKDVILALGILILGGCGKSDTPPEVCRPQDIAIAECLVEEFEKNPSPLMTEYQRRYCERLYPYKVCYYR